MKNQKSNIPAFVPAFGLACLLFWAGCSGDDAPAVTAGTDGVASIRFVSTIIRFTGDDTPGTRATIGEADGMGSFANGDEIMINVGQDYPATYRDGTWITGITWDELGEGAEASFRAFFPKQLQSEVGVLFDLPVGQNDPAQYAAADMLLAVAVNQERTDSPIQLAFKHIMHRLTVNLSLADNPGTLVQADVDAATVVIKNMCTSGHVSWNGDAFLSSEAPKADFTPWKSATGNTFYTILWPQDVTSGTSWIEVTVAGKTVTYRVPAGLTNLQEEKETVVDLKLTDSTQLAG